MWRYIPAAIAAATFIYKVFNDDDSGSGSGGSGDPTPVTGFTLPKRKLEASDYRQLRSKLFGILNQGARLDVSIELSVVNGVRHRKALEEAILQWQNGRHSIGIRGCSQDAREDGTLDLQIYFTDDPSEFVR